MTLPFRLERLVGSPFAGVLLVAAALGATAFGLALRDRLALPLLQAAAAYPFFLGGVLARRPTRLLALFSVWAVALSAPMILAATLEPERTAAIVIHGPAYRDEMLTWIRTGSGPEADPSRFLPVHAMHFAVFAVLAFVTVGFGALAMGCVLLNYMNLYVGSLLAEAAYPLAAAPFAWPVYAVVRVVGYVACATALARLAVSLWRRDPSDRRSAARGLLLGFALLVLDAGLKAALAPFYGERLRAALAGTF